MSSSKQKLIKQRNRKIWSIHKKKKNLTETTLDEAEVLKLIVKDLKPMNGLKCTQQWSKEHLTEN